MDGYLSDLRTGLPWQMVEIHEPVRSLFIIETTPEAMLQHHGTERGHPPAVRPRLGDPRAGRPADRRPSASSATATFQPYRPQSQVLPRAASSVEWYRGWRDHLEFAEIES